MGKGKKKGGKQQQQQQQSAAGDPGTSTSPSPSEASSKGAEAKQKPEHATERAQPEQTVQEQQPQPQAQQEPGATGGGGKRKRGKQQQQQQSAAGDPSRSTSPSTSEASSKGAEVKQKVREEQQPPQPQTQEPGPTEGGGGGGRRRKGKQPPSGTGQEQTVPKSQQPQEMSPPPPVPVQQAQQQPRQTMHQQQQQQLAHQQQQQLAHQQQQQLAHQQQQQLARQQQQQQLPAYQQQQQQQMQQQFAQMQPPSGRGAPSGGAWGRGQRPPFGAQLEPPGDVPSVRGAPSGGAWGRGQRPPSGAQLVPPGDVPSLRGAPSGGAWGRGQRPPSGAQLEPPGDVPSGTGRGGRVQVEPSRGRGGAPRGQERQQFRPPPSDAPSGPGGDGGGGDRAPVRQQQQQPPPPRPVARQQQAAGDTYDFELKLNPQKRTGGTRGRQIDLFTNHFPLKLGKVQRAVHYDVSIDPDKPKKLFHEVMRQFRLKYYPQRYPAFDGAKNMYSSSPLSPPLPASVMSEGFTGEVNVDEDGRSREYKVTIKYATFVDLSVIQRYQRGNMQTPSQALQCIDVVLRSAPIFSCIPVGRSFFSLPREGQSYSLGDGSELYYGFFQSAILGWKPFLNVDVAHKAFPKAISVNELIAEICGDGFDPRRGLEHREHEAVNRHMKTLKVLYEIPGNPGSRRVYRVNELNQTPATAKFHADDRKELMTVQQYFQTEKRVQLRWPNLPCLWVGSRANPDRKILLPSEFCTILSGQAVNKKMTETQTRNLIRRAATSTEVRMRNIMGSIRQANYNASPAVKEFDLAISESPQEIKGRVLQPPTLQYKDRKQNVSRGVWRAGMFESSASLKTWTILNLDRRTRDDKLAELEKQIKIAGRDLGMDVQDAATPYVGIYSYGPRLLSDLKNYFNGKKSHQLIVVVITESNFVYNYVKQASELAAGCLTQCVKGNTVFRLNRSTANNILLKINTKLNCLNHSLATTPPCLMKPCMIMGADVTHPSPDARGIPSVAAVTASFERKAFKYNFCWRLQDPTQEIISDLQAITKQQLEFFFKKNNSMKPERIIFFRDGVSDGQFEQVLNVELKAIRAACSSIDLDYKPSITFLVVQKRHHTRFFPRNQRDSEDKNFNVPAGTCVDTEITHPAAQDFYLVSHASIQGVAKPTKYRTLWDDANMNDDELEELTYYLCHLFARCTRSVSYPAPTYYAHLAAARAKVYCETENIDMNNLQREQERLKVQDCIIRDLPMYFV